MVAVVSRPAVGFVWVTEVLPPGEQMRSGTVRTVEADDLRMQHTPTAADAHRVG